MRASFHNLNIALEERNPVGMKTKALVIRSIAPLVESPLHTEALTDEALCGMTVEVLEQQGAWNYIRTPYRYEGWMHEGCLEKDPVCIKKRKKMEKKAVWFRCADILKEPRYPNQDKQHLTFLLTFCFSPTLYWKQEICQVAIYLFNSLYYK